jgi:chromodomain-helicase-DNA-binding protein 1
MFDKEELSAILRFGAEKLFKTGGEPGEEENKAEEEEQAQALYEESIDDILARAEKVETSTAAAAEGGANELLNQFNYATFKNEEDDATFWSRLIPVEKRV